MSGKEVIEHNGKVMAMVVREGTDVQGIEFYTPESYPLQLGSMIHEAGGEIRPHIHLPSERVIKETHEVVRVDFRLVDVDLYTEEGEKFKTVRLSKGDTILFASGGHGFRFPERTKMTEVKQGPYSGKENDKELIPSEG